MVAGEMDGPTARTLVSSYTFTSLHLTHPLGHLETCHSPLRPLKVPSARPPLKRGGTNKTTILNVLPPYSLNVTLTRLLNVLPPYSLNVTQDY
ncbi:hypothetical protein Pmani_021381 [Petrolisthes manimaculis]|uniref:Uncharacterized protein n=1 Tax=Petrolisthes manimaculis TaxID=1843537 RepID=A0AAE1PGT7_9EUCA|nr:hypothetical protein Pmani_021381 [Petrolisthes manimaculis]